MSLKETVATMRSFFENDDHGDDAALVAAAAEIEAAADKAAAGVDALLAVVERFGKASDRVDPDKLMTWKRIIQWSRDARHNVRMVKEQAQYVETLVNARTRARSEL